MQCYILSKADMSVKAAANPVRYEISEDAASPAQSSFTFAAPVDAAIGDFVLLRNSYLGICSGIEADKNTTAVTLQALPISSLFSRNILLGAGDAVTENFIFSAIRDNFISSGDAVLDIPYLWAEAVTQTPLGVIPHNDNGIYNLDTFLRYVAKRHGIFADFTPAPGMLRVLLGQREPKRHIIDATVADVLHLSETVVSKCVSKVTVKTSAGTTTYYLFTDGSYGTDPSAGIRSAGQADAIYCENPEDEEAAAADAFAKNQFSHLIEAEIFSGSLLYDVSGIRLFDRATVKTRSGIYDTYVSYIHMSSSARTTLVRFGDAKLTLTDKLKGGM